MKWKQIGKTGLLCLALAMSCSAAACAEETPEEALEEMLAEGTKEEAEEHTEENAEVNTDKNTRKSKKKSKAIVKGEVVDVLNEAYMLEDASYENGWVILTDGEGKGFGSPWMAMNLEKDISVKAEEGAEVYLGSEGLLRFAWKNQESGEELKASQLFFSTGEEPVTAVLCGEYLDWAGELIEEKEIATYAQAEGGDYYSEIQPLVEQAVTEWGGSLYHTDKQTITFQTEGEDAVGYDPSGTEVIRYPGEEAGNIWASLSADGKVLCVCFWMDGRTEIFELE